SRFTTVFRGHPGPSTTAGGAHARTTVGIKGIFPKNPGGSPRRTRPASTVPPAMGRAVGSPHGWGVGPMTAVLTRARAELRARLKSIVALTLLVGIGTAAVMTLAAGARRTDTAYPRFARAYGAPDMIVFDASGFDPKFAHIDFKQAAALPQVTASGEVHLLGTADQTVATVYWDGALGTTMNRMKLLEGKQPDPRSIDEVAV